MAKPKKIGMGSYDPTDEERDAFMWCIDHDIKVAPYAATSGPDPIEWYLDIQIKDGKVNRSPKKFAPVEVWEVLYSYYIHYAKKRKPASSKG